MKSIPTPSHQSYKLLLIDNIKSITKKNELEAYLLMENEAVTLEEPGKEIQVKTSSKSI